MTQLLFRWNTPVQSSWWMLNISCNSGQMISGKRIISITAISNKFDFTYYGKKSKIRPVRGIEYGTHENNPIFGTPEGIDIKFYFVFNASAAIVQFPKNPYLAIQEPNWWIRVILDLDPDDIAYVSLYHNSEELYECVVEKAAENLVQDNQKIQVTAAVLPSEFVMADELQLQYDQEK